MSVQSRHLGQIELVGGSGGGRMDTAIPLGGITVPFRLEIDFPEKLDQTVRHIDMALDGLAGLDKMARDTIAAGLRREGSAADQLFRTQQHDDSDEFLRRLRPVQISLLPDGGSSSLDRLVMAYGLPDSATSGTVTVRFRERTGPELDPAPRGAFA